LIAFFSVEHTALIGGDHVLDVDESVLATVHFEHFQGFLDQVTKVQILSLGVLDLVTDVGVLSFKEIQNGQDLSVVRHKGLTNGVRAGNKSLQNLQCDGNDLSITSVQSSFDGNDKLRDDREHLGTALFKHIEYTLDRKETVWVSLLTDTFEEDGQVVMVVELHDIDLPEDCVALAMLNGNGQITSIIETSEFTGCDQTSVSSTSSRLSDNWLLLGLSQRGSLATNTAAALEDSSSSSGDALLSSVSDRHGLHNQRFLGQMSGREVTEA